MSNKTMSENSNLKASDKNNKELLEKLKKYRLSISEYDLICDRLKREPQGVEWAVFSALWSEHCSYKSSKIHLRKFQKTTKNVVAAMGENAGVVDLGQGERIAFKMESHNHPSYIEPYQGAATGVGGILRDIFTMGARPIALANYLCFGSPQFPRMQKLIDGVVRGIAGYGNCVGVPMLTGQTEFNEQYNHNILVNALAVGYLGPKDKMASAKKSVAGAKVVYVGAKTGRDGIHGASMASQSFDSGSELQRPTVQIGDPFYEKLLIESCIEVIQQDLVIAIQDMGAAGLTSSSFEMASSGDVGLNLNLDLVPLRDSTLTPEDILLSESQERMLLICHEHQFPKIETVFKNWDLDAVIIGEVIPESVVRLNWHNETIAEINPKLVVDNAPVYDRAHDAWTAKNRAKQKTDLNFKNALEVIKSVDANVSSKKSIFEQYDQRVGASTFLDCSDPIGAVRLPSGRGLGLALGCRPNVMAWDARQGALDAIALPSIKLAAFGFKPMAATDCLNFGNPEKKEIMSEFVASVDAITELCETLEVPVVSGNVSFYNQTSGKDIISTPAIGIIGLKDNVSVKPSSKIVDSNLEVLLLSQNQMSFDGSKGFGEIVPEQIKKFVDTLLSMNLKNWLQSVHVVGEHGALYTLSKMLTKNCGIKVNEDVTTTLEKSICTFYEVLVAVKKSDLELVKTLCQPARIKCLSIGSTIENGELQFANHKMTYSELNEWRTKAWRNNIGSIS